MVNPAGYVPAYPDHAPVLDGDVHRVPVGVENGGRLYPAIHILLRDSLLQEGIDTNGPELTRTVRTAPVPASSRPALDDPLPPFIGTSWATPRSSPSWPRSPRRPLLPTLPPQARYVMLPVSPAMDATPPVGGTAALRRRAPSSHCASRASLVHGASCP